MVNRLCSKDYRIRDNPTLTKLITDVCIFDIYNNNYFMNIYLNRVSV